MYSPMPVRGCHKFLVTRRAFFARAVAGAALPAKAQAIVTAKLCQPLPLNCKKQMTSIHIRQKTSYSPKQAFAMRQ